MIVLDLFCGAGGASMGYNRAGFDVVGVDIEPQPRYPFEFVQGDALQFLRNGGARGFDLIHASPPCQRHTSLVRGKPHLLDQKVDLVKETRNLLIESGVEYVIENVPSASLIDPITLCGEMFGLNVIRHRVFEISVPIPAPKHVKHRGAVRGWNHGKLQDGPYCAVYGNGGGKGNLDDWREAMDVWWMETRPEMAQAIPPAYTEYIGNALAPVLGDSDAAAGLKPSRRAEAYCSQCGRRTSPDLAYS
jgi:hypothetical protein